MGQAGQGGRVCLGQANAVVGQAQVAQAGQAPEAVRDCAQVIVAQVQPAQIRETVEEAGR
ncbi:hypothetical protein D3C84_1145890 [compost metagenome]